MNKDFSISKITLSVNNMEEMIHFYSIVFGAEFREIEGYGTKLYTTVIAGSNMLFCPNDIAGVDANQNRHQFDYFVSELDSVIEKVKASGGRIQGNIHQTRYYKSISAIDPDGNTMVFIQKLQ